MTTLLLLAVIAAVLLLASKAALRRGADESARPVGEGLEASPPRPDAAPASWLQRPTLAPGGFEEVVGEASYQSNLLSVAEERLPDGTRVSFAIAQLTREPTNRHDRNAVRIDIGGRTVGYIPRKRAPRFHAILDELARNGTPATCHAQLLGGWDRGEDNRGHIGVGLDLDPRLRLMADDAPSFRGANVVQIVGEEHYQDALSKRLGRKLSLDTVATLEESVSSPHRPGAAGPFVLVKIDGTVIGQLSPTMRDRYLPLVREMISHNAAPTCAAAITRGEKKIEVKVRI